MARDNKVVTTLVQAELAELREVEQLKRLLVLVAGTMKNWALRHGLFEQQVGQTLRGDRDYPEIRQKMAEDVGWSRSRVDRAIEEEKARRAAEREALVA